MRFVLTRRVSRDLSARSILPASFVGALFTALVILTCYSAPLAARPLQFKRFSIANGLSQSTVNAILLDREGYLWFGTQDGLNRFDGYSFTVFQHDPNTPGSLSGNFVQALHEDRDGRLWIGTAGGGLNTFDLRTGTFTAFRSKTPTPAGVNSIHRILEDDTGTLWTAGIDPRTLNNITMMKADRAGNL